MRATRIDTAPQLAVGDGALGFWKAVAKKWPNTQTQRGREPFK